jgi:hypothetical protein
MLLENPERSRRLTDVVASIPDKLELTQRLIKLNRTLARQNKQDADLIDGLRRILESTNPQAKQVRELIKGIANNG